MANAQLLPIGPQCAVILAASGIESTRLALHSFPTALMGRNLMAHVRSDFTSASVARRCRRCLRTSRRPRSSFAVSTPSGRFHLQVTASTHTAGSDELLFRMIPDLDILSAQLANQDPDWITITLRGIGEMHGDPDDRDSQRDHELDRPQSP